MNNKGIVFVLLAGILWSAMGLFVRYFSRFGLYNRDLVSIRAFVSLSIFAIYILLKDKALFKIRLRDTWIFLGSGVLCFIGFNVLYFATINMTSLSVAAVLLYTSPIFVMLFSALLFKESLSRRKLLCLLFAFLGSMLVSGIFKSDANITALGFIMGLGSGLGYGLYSIFTRFGLQCYHTLTTTFYTFLFAALGCIFLCDLPRLADILINQHLLPFSLLFAIATSVLPYLLYNIGLLSMETGRAAIIACIEPVAATVFSITVLKEPFDWLMAIGITLVLTSIAILNLQEKEKQSAR